MKNLTNLFWGLGLVGIVSLGLIDFPENKQTKMGETQIVTNQQVKNPQTKEEDYLFLLSVGLLYSGGVGIFSSRYIKNSKNRYK